MRLRSFVFTFYHFPFVITRPPISISHLAFFTSAADDAFISTSKSFSFNYLVETFGFSETLAASIAKRLPHFKNPQKSDSVVSFLRQHGFSETHIRDAVRIAPQILVSDIEKILKPKLKLFQELGLSGSDLGLFLSKYATLLTYSLEHKLIPCIKVLKSILWDNRDVVRVLQGCKWILCKDPNLRLLPNISLLQSCGIVESQLVMLLKQRPVLFAAKQSVLRHLVERLRKMGFSTDSRMFVYALYTISFMMPESLQRKFDIFQSFGLSEEETMLIFRKAPSLLRTSEKKLKLGLELFLNTINIDRSVLINNPYFLMYSIEKRVIPRCRVIEILRSNMVLKKDPSIVYAIQMSERKFFKYILKLGDGADELLLAYKGGIIESPKREIL